MLTGYEDVELDRLLKRQQELERAVFSRPPASWEMFNQQLGRWLELNDAAKALKSRLNDEDRQERNK